MLNININMNHLEKIKEYYNEISKDLNDKILELMKTNEIFGKFIILATNNNIFLFKKKNNNWYFKTNDQILKDYKMKKKTILRKHASQLIELSKSEISDNDKEIDNLSKYLKANLKEIGVVIKLYKKLEKENLFDIFKNTKINLEDLKKLGTFNDYSKLSKIKTSKRADYKVNEVNYIAEYGN